MKGVDETESIGCESKVSNLWIDSWEACNSILFWESDFIKEFNLSKQWTWSGICIVWKDFIVSSVFYKFFYLMFFNDLFDSIAPALLVLRDLCELRFLLSLMDWLLEVDLGLSYLELIFDEERVFGMNVLGTGVG